MNCWKTGAPFPKGRAFFYGNPSHRFPDNNLLNPEGFLRACRDGPTLFGLFWIPKLTIAPIRFWQGTHPCTPLRSAAPRECSPSGVQPLGRRVFKASPLRQGI